MYNFSTSGDQKKPTTSSSGAGDISLQIGNGVYRLVDLYTKTLYATKDIPVYSGPAMSKKVYTIKRGEPVGTIRGFYPKGRNGAKANFFLVGPNSKTLSFVPYEPSSFSETKLKQQGTKTQREVFDDQVQSDKPWYMKLTEGVAPWLALAAVGVAYVTSNKSGK